MDSQIEASNAAEGVSHGALTPSGVLTPSPLPGDDDFLGWIAAGHRDGWITTEEALERERTHELVLRAEAA
jgi:hypothetical protein